MFLRQAGEVADYYSLWACPEGADILKGHTGEGILSALRKSQQRWHLHVLPARKAIVLECERCLSGQALNF